MNLNTELNPWADGGGRYSSSSFTGYHDIPSPVVHGYPFREGLELLRFHLRILQYSSSVFKSLQGITCCLKDL